MFFPKIKLSLLTVALLVASLPPIPVYSVGRYVDELINVYKVNMENELEIIFRYNGTAFLIGEFSYNITYRVKERISATIKENTIKGSIYYTCQTISVSVETAENTTSITTSPSEEQCPLKSREISESLEQYLSSALNRLISISKENYTSSTLRGNETYSFNTVYEGVGYHGKLPVYKLRVNLNAAKHQRTIGGEYSAEMNGYIEPHLYAGFPVPVYSRVVIHIEIRSAFVNATYIVKAEYRNVKNNFNKFKPLAKYTVIDLDSATLIISSLKGTDISLKGLKGSNTLTVSNSGTEPGYLIIAYNSGTFTLSNQTSGNTPYKVYVVMPGEKRNLKLGFTLDRDVDAKVSGVSSDIVGILISLHPLIILIAIAVPVAWVIYRNYARLKSEAESFGEGGEETGEETL